MHAGLKGDCGAALLRPRFDKLPNSDRAARADVDDKWPLETQDCESREVVRHDLDGKVIAQLISRAHREEFRPRLACAMELTIQRLRRLSRPIRIEQSCPDDVDAKIYP